MYLCTTITWHRIVSIWYDCCINISLKWLVCIVLCTPSHNSLFKILFNYMFDAMKCRPKTGCDWITYPSCNCMKLCASAIWWPWEESRQTTLSAVFRWKNENWSAYNGSVGLGTQHTLERIHFVIIIYSLTSGLTVEFFFRELQPIESAHCVIRYCMLRLCIVCRCRMQIMFYIKTHKIRIHFRRDLREYPRSRCHTLLK